MRYAVEYLGRWSDLVESISPMSGNRVQSFGPYSVMRAEKRRSWPPKLRSSLFDHQTVFVACAMYAFHLWEGMTESEDG